MPCVKGREKARGVITAGKMMRPCTLTAAAGTRDSGERDERQLGGGKVRRVRDRACKHKHTQRGERESVLSPVTRLSGGERARESEIAKKEKEMHTHTLGPHYAVEETNRSRFLPHTQRQTHASRCHHHQEHEYPAHAILGHRRPVSLFHRSSACVC